jgi:hypothetical protein
MSFPAAEICLLLDCRIWQQNKQVLVDDRLALKWAVAMNDALAWNLEVERWAHRARKSHPFQRFTLSRQYTIGKRSAPIARARFRWVG